MAKTYDSSKNGHDEDQDLQSAVKIIDKFNQKSETEKRAYIQKLRGFAVRHASDKELSSAFESLADALTLNLKN